MGHKYFKNKKRILKIKENRPTELECALVGSTRLKKNFVIHKVSVDLTYDDKRAEISIDEPAAAWGNWAVNTRFPLKEKTNSFKIDFEAVRKDISNVGDNKKDVQDGVLLNERVEMSYEVSINYLEHFVRMGSGVEEMTDWELFYEEFAVGVLDDAVSSLGVKSLEDKNAKVQTADQKIFQRSADNKWVNDEGKEETFLSPVSDDYMFMFLTKGKKKKLMEIETLNFSCEWDAKDIKI